MNELLIVLKYTFTALLIAVVWRLGPCARRSFTKQAQEIDPLWALICGFALNRLWFIWRNTLALQKPREPWDEASLVIGYIFAIALAVGTLAVFNWHKKRHTS